jgi:Family of unknown function (DUF6801)
MARRIFRRSGWAAAASGLILVAAGTQAAVSGITADAPPGARQDVRVQLGYTCRFPSGVEQVSVAVAATFPASAATGKLIQPTGLRTTVTLPHAALADVTKTGASEVTGNGVLNTSVTSGGVNTAVQWPGRMSAPLPIPATGSLSLLLPGLAPPVSATTPGTVTFTAGGLALSLTPGEASQGEGHLPTPGTVQVACALSRGQHAGIANVPVLSASPSPSASATASPRGGRHPQAPAASGGTGGGIPPKCAQMLVHGGTSSPVLGCAYLLGYADVRKLHGAALVGPAVNGSAPAALLHVDTYGSDVGCVPAEPTAAKCASHHGEIHVFSCSVAQLDYHRKLEFPPARSTFLSFGFTPVSAVMHLSEVPWPRNKPPTENKKCYRSFTKFKPVTLKSPIISIFSDLGDAGHLPVLNIGTTYLAIRISHVTANGVPLNVGPHCEAAHPVKAVLTGHGTNNPVSGYTIDLGGPLAGDVTIPNFTHCGVGENLDPLLSATISGPANFQLMTQGTLCTPNQSGKPGCPPTIPKPKRHL